MSRFGGDYENNAPPDFWWENTRRAYAGKRGLRVLLDVRDALRGLPKRELLGGAFASFIYDDEGEIVSVDSVCVVGAYCYSKGMEPREFHSSEDMSEFETAEAGQSKGMTYVMAWDLAYHNDDLWGEDPPSTRWWKMYQFVTQKIRRNPHFVEVR